jgi:hypothetical protein
MNRAVNRHAGSSRNEEIVLAYVGTAGDQQAILETVGEARTVFAPNPQSLTRLAADPRTAALILDVQLIGAAPMRELVDLLARRSRPIPVLLRFALNPHAIRLALSCEPRCHDLRLSLRGYDDLSSCIARLETPMLQEGARRAIVTRAATHAPDRVLDVVVGAAIAGERRTSVRDLAALCGVSVRRIEERLASAGLPSAKRLLMGMLAAHSHWRLSRLGWSGKLAAGQAGFQSGDALSRRLKRATGAGLDELRRSAAVTLDDFDGFVSTMMAPR